jgi:hypothetical protein
LLQHVSEAHTEKLTGRLLLHVVTTRSFGQVRQKTHPLHELLQIPVMLTSTLPLLSSYQPSTTPINN